jgi:hypothetical protein
LDAGAPPKAYFFSMTARLHLYERHDREPVAVVIGVHHAVVSMNRIEFVACVAVVERGTLAALAAHAVKLRTS